MSSWNRAFEEAEESNDEGLLEGELAQLQLRYRMMQQSFHAYKEETSRKIGRQKNLVKRLEYEKLGLDNDLGNLETPINKAKDEHNLHRLEELSNNEKDYRTLITEEQTRIQEIENQCDTLRGKVASKRKRIGGIYSASEAYVSTKRAIAVLENRLDQAVTRFNKQLAKNNALRSDIDNLRYERAIFDNLYNKLDSEVERTKKEMTEVINQSTEAFEQRDEAHNKMLALIERSEKDKEMHDIEIRDLQRMIEHDNRIREFMGIKSSDRAALKAEEAAKKQKLDADKVADDDRLTIKQYEEKLARMKESTKQTEISDIVKTFERHEEENFALFNYVNELNNEMESLTEQADAVKRDIAQFKTEDQKLDEIHANMVRQMEEQIDTAETEHEQTSNNLRQVNKLLDELLSNVSDLFTRIGCDPQPLVQMLDTESAIRVKNVMVYMGQIEQRTIELLTAQAYKQKKQAALNGELLLRTTYQSAVPKPPGITQLSIIPPSVGMDEVVVPIDESDDSGPFTQEELRKQVEHYIKMRGVLCSTSMSTISHTREKKKHR